MHSAPILVSPPATEPVALDDAKLRLRLVVRDSFGNVPAHEEDSTVTDLIVSARSAVEQKIAPWVLVTQDWREDFDNFAREMWLIKRPVQSIVSVVWRSSDGTLTTISADDYVLRHDGLNRSHVRFDSAFTLPTDLWESRAVQVTYRAGFGGAADVPANIRQAVYLLVGHWFANREAVSLTSVHELPLGVQSLLETHIRLVA